MRILFILLVIAQAGCGGIVRERVKQRVMSKLEAEPPVIASSDWHNKIEKSGSYVFTFKHAEVDRFYKIHVPSGYSTQKPAALIFSFHGGGGDMSVQSNDEYYKLISKSEKEGFIVVFPNGYSKFQSGRLATWNAGRCCGDARDKNIDDVGFVRELVKKVTHQLAIDPKRIFAIGMSNGGMMSYRLACELSGTIKGIASVAGTDNTIGCAPGTAVSILHIHAKDDDRALFNGGAGKAFRDESKVTHFESVPNTVAKWAKINLCEKNPRRVLDKADAHCELYSQCKNGSRVQLCVTEDGKHSWPGGSKPLGGEPGSKAIQANDVIWEFFKSI